MKICNKISRTIGVFLFLGNQALSQDQGLDLFQATDNGETNQPARRAVQRNSERNTEPMFTLVGTSRFGENYLISLKSKDNNQLIVEWTKGRVKEIDGYSGYSILDSGFRSVSIRLPDSESCVENPAKGVRCNGNIALLALANASPVERKKTVKQTEQQTDESQTSNNDNLVVSRSDQNSETNNAANTLPPNPFSGLPQVAPNLTPEQIAEREERRARRAEQFQNFEIVRIPDDEIPEGMQRIRTPFGDSLEPAED